MNPVDFDVIQKLKTEWDSLQPLSKENEERLWQKLRLEWNYHSNHMEGNTLTYGETERLFLFGEVDGPHTMREYDEMRAHDVAIGHVYDLTRESRPLSEADVRGLNELLLKKPYWKKAKTQEGEGTRKQVVPGRYKVQPNSVRTVTDEMFHYMDPSDVPMRMPGHLAMINSDLPSGPVLFGHLARLHHEFLLIHPFDDGNGRVARLLLNYVLLRGGYPPIVIRTDEKSAYFAALHRADTEERDYSALSLLFQKALRWSLELGVKAGKGQEIKEPFDIEKKIALYAAEHADVSPLIATKELVTEFWEKNLYPIFLQIETRSVALRKLFSSVDLRANTMGGNDWNMAVRRWLSNYHYNTNIPLIFRCEGSNAKGVAPFDLEFSFQIIFRKYDYTLHLDPLPPHLGTYSESFSPSQMDDLAERFLEAIFEVFQKRAAEN